MTDLNSFSALPPDDVDAIDHLRDTYGKLAAELSKVIVGQQNVVEQLCICSRCSSSNDDTVALLHPAAARVGRCNDRPTTSHRGMPRSCVV